MTEAQVSRTRPRRSVILYSAIVLIVAAAGLITFLVLRPEARVVYPTYFTYTVDELARIRSLDSDRRTSIDDLFDWEDRLFDLVNDEKIGTRSVSKILPYLVVAQRDGAYLSFNAHQEFKGSIDPVSRQVACIFIPDVCQEIPVKTDAFSELIAEIVMRKVTSRIREAEEETKVYELKPEERYWSGNGKAKVLGQRTWLIESPAKFRVPGPVEYGSEADEEQIQMVKDAVNNITNDQRLAVLRWSGGPGTKGARAHWLDLATKHMRETGFSDIGRALMIRSVLQMTVWDSWAAANDSKYTHLVKRPFARAEPDNPIYTVMPTPKGPAYPSTSTSIAWASATVMAHYFPDRTDEWTAIADEIGNSRVWSGVHFPMDVEQGVILGRQVALEGLLQAE